MRTGWLALVALLALVVAPGTSAAGTQTRPLPGPYQGMNDGAAYLIEIPQNWNGTLVLYSHGYVRPGEANPATDVGDPVTHDYLLGRGYALAGSAYSATGWAVKEALHDQIALLDLFNTKFARPTRTIAWGHSLGGMITAGLVERHPERIDAALPLCGVLAGGVGVWNSGLDAAFVFKTLLDSSNALQLVHIQDANTNLLKAEAVLAAAQGDPLDPNANPQGRARIALAAAVGDVPGWFAPGSPEPAATAFGEQESNQFAWDQQVDFPFLFALRAELEARAGGNPSWNTDVDYRRLLDKSVNRAEVEALYAQAGLSLNADLERLAAAPRVKADPAAVRYLVQWIVYSGVIVRPVLTLHTTGDGLVVNQNEDAYRSTVLPGLSQVFLRQAFVHRAGHCTFTPAETIAAFNALVSRLDRHVWSGVSAAQLQSAALEVGGPVPPAYIQFDPSEFPRPFDLRDALRLRLN